MRTLKLVFLGLLLLQGCKEDPPSPPTAAVLVSPEKNSECSPIDSDSGTTNLVRFSWLESPNTDSYQLRVTKLNSGSPPEVKTTTALSEVVALTKGIPYSWSVTSKNDQVTEIALSETWFFFSPGSETSFAPFPAELVAPSGVQI